ncbi:hypothetical protein ASPACDRAFT_44247 [Aspergillus aculeatus ATCC 16872]|uniref:F-box domain-containing protein n=1 Tax=Aspergillus aculeatus (strain ATCC 16872 / CBS 172.66 / WB 5094) TaxID=690307 RepID=A0A1L9WR24_ASPA1|nr:uncharacterized protein ASPACDRAFT_44247 [Aspergillus aculeatus ATCC 16872]OJJ98616.1 hypothetical protein ASPACDRAFT_44247 [Aspergillus aculeatus ATCC 16872]
MDEQLNNPLIQLPNELHLQYAYYLDARALSRLSRTCKKLKNKFSEELERAREAHEWAIVAVNYWGGEWGSQTTADIEARMRQDNQGAAIAVEAHPKRWKRYPRLYHVIKMGQIDLVQNYLRARGDPNLRIRLGAMPSINKPLLHWALYTGNWDGHTTIVRLLLEYGADPNLDETDRKEGIRGAGTALDWVGREHRGLYFKGQYPQPGDAERTRLALSYGARASLHETIYSLYQMEDGSALVQMAVVNGTDLMQLGFEWHKLVGTLFWEETRNRFTDEQVRELLTLEPKLVTLVTDAAKSAVPYIRRHRLALAERLIREPSPSSWLANLFADL